MSREVGQYRFDFHSNNLNISIGNELNHVVNVLGRVVIFLSLLTVTNKTISD